MKIIITGSLGNISKPLTKELVQKGHSVTVISSKPEKKKEIEAIGAIPAIGTIEDVEFLTNTFKGADVVYCMLPPFKFLENPNIDVRQEALRIANNYKQAIEQSGVKRIVHLSSIGAHLDKGNGILIFHNIVEKTLQQLPTDVAITHMRPVSFYYNLFDFMDMIKGKGFLEGFVGKILTLRYYGLISLLKGKKGIMLSNYGGKDKIPWVSPFDIATAIAEEILAPPVGRKVRYVASEELTGYEVASILGEAIGKPYLKWELISDKQLLSGMKDFGASDSLSNDVTEMNASMHSGKLYEDYYRNRPTLGKVKLKDFAKEFAVAYNKNN
jgi:uncharacterized protein YbjT (DUF2867 family)